EALAHHGLHQLREVRQVDVGLERWLIDELLDRLRDVHRRIADALEVAVDLHHRHEEAEVDRGRLLAPENAVTDLVDLDLELIDVAVALDDLGAESRFALEEGLRRLRDHPLHHSSHAQQHLPYAIEVLIQTSFHDHEVPIPFRTAILVSDGWRVKGVGTPGCDNPPTAL